MRLEALRIPLEVITPSSSFRLLAIRSYFRYIGAEKTDEVAGYRYTVGDAETFEQYDVKIAGPALIQPAQLDTITEPIVVQFSGCYAKPYRRDNGSYELSFSAEAIRIIQ